MPLARPLRKLLTGITLNLVPAQVPVPIRKAVYDEWVKAMKDEFPNLGTCRLTYAPTTANRAFVELHGERSGVTPDADKENPIALRAFSLLSHAVAKARNEAVGTQSPVNPGEGVPPPPAAG